MDAYTLHSAIVEVCPAISTAVGKPDDRATWSFEPTPEATQEQKDAGNNVIATIPVDQKTLPPPGPGEEALYDHENRIRALEGQPALDAAALQAKWPRKHAPKRG